MNVTGKDLHDFLLREGGDFKSHNPEQCVHCAAKASWEGKYVAEKILDQDQHDQLVAAAVEKAVAEARAEADKEILRLTTELDNFKDQLEKSEQRIEELDTEIARRDDEARLRELADERAKKIKEVANFSDEQIESRKDGWAKLDEAQFEAVLEDFKTVVAQAKEVAQESTKPETSFSGTRETAGEDGSEFKALRRLLQVN